MNAVGTDYSAQELSVIAAQAAEGKGGTDVVAFDVGDLLGICECFVVASAGNPRLVKAVVDEVERAVKDATGRSPRSVEGAAERRWVLLDYGDVVVHVFSVEDREYYRIERLYADAPPIRWQ
ncbi:MAG: ribosome silencing factor [Actinomycetes bacterium]